MRSVTLLAVGIASILAGCGRDYGLRCEDSSRYSNAAEIPPVRVPDDLSVPDETQALRIPQAPSPEETPDSTEEPGPCLESPPDYYGGTTPEAEAAAVPAGSDPASPAPPR